MLAVLGRVRAWLVSMLAFRLVSLQAMENPSILPCKSKDYLSYQWALDPEALAEALGSSIADQAMGYPLVMTAL